MKGNRLPADFTGEQAVGATSDAAVTAPVTEGTMSAKETTGLGLRRSRQPYFVEGIMKRPGFAPASQRLPNVAPHLLHRRSQTTTLCRPVCQDPS